jgi:hypothetical protein
MILNPNAMWDLARLRNHELLVDAQRARLARGSAPEQHSPLEPPQDIDWRRSKA